jgi:hypothetical protein
MSFIRNVGVAAATAGLVFTLIPGSVAADDPVVESVTAVGEPTFVNPSGSGELPEGGGTFIVTGGFTFDGVGPLDMSFEPATLPGASDASLSGSPCDGPDCGWTFQYPAVDDFDGDITVTGTLPSGVKDSQTFHLTVTNVDPWTSVYQSLGSFPYWCSYWYMSFPALDNNGYCSAPEGEDFRVEFSGTQDPGPIDQAKGFTYLVDCGDGTWHEATKGRAGDPWDAGYECMVTKDGPEYGYVGPNYYDYQPIPPGSTVPLIKVRARVCDKDAQDCTTNPVPTKGKHQHVVPTDPAPEQDGKYTESSEFAVNNEWPDAKFRVPQTAVEGTIFNVRFIDAIDVAGDLVPPPGLDGQAACGVEMTDVNQLINAKHPSKAAVKKLIRAMDGDETLTWVPMTPSSDGTTLTGQCTAVDGPADVWVAGRLSDKDLDAAEEYYGESEKIGRTAGPDAKTSGKQPKQYEDDDWCYYQYESNYDDWEWAECYEPRLVHVQNAPPLISDVTVVSPASTLVNAKVTATFSDPGTGDIHTCDIDWGDGTKVNNATVTEVSGAGTCTGTHPYTTSGRFKVEVTITDNDGASRSAATPFTVNGPPPPPANVKPVVSKPTFTGAGAATTPMSAAFTDANTTDTHICDIDWGDGSTDAGSVSEANGAGTCTGNHTFGGPGSYPVQVTITDNPGASRSASASYTVNGPPPPPDPTSVYQPDVLVRFGGANHAFIGDNVYDATGNSQKLNVTIPRGTDRTFIVRFTNNGNVADTFRIYGFGQGHGVRVAYYKGVRGSEEITSAVTAGSYAIGALNPGQSVTIRMVIRPNSHAAVGDLRTFKVTATSQSDAAKKDAIKVVATVS